MKTPTNGGRPKGTCPISRADLIARFNRRVAPFSEEIMERAVSQALQGDGLALAAIVELMGRVLSSSAEAKRPLAAAA